jgi:hypothetical protein
MKSNLINGIMVNVLALSAVDHGFEPRSSKARGYKIGICCFSSYPFFLWQAEFLLPRKPNTNATFIPK